MKTDHSDRAVLLISCKDSKGIVAEVTSFIYRHNGNIISADQYTDFDEEQFFMRLEWELDGFEIDRDSVPEKFEHIRKKFFMKYDIFFSNNKPSIAVFVSRQNHCLLEILWRHKQNELKGNIKCIISNHRDLEEIAKSFDIPYYFIEKNGVNKKEAEEKEFKILKDNDIDLIVLAKYMQILSPEYEKKYPGKIINIHHSFLPAFEGAKPYHRAHERGVKLVGATAHYVNSELDAGPIIDQAVIRVSHKDSIEDYVRKGRDLEKILLVRGLLLHLDHRILLNGNRTVIFE